MSIKPIIPQNTMKRLGLEQRGRIQKVWTANVARRIKKYLPYRNYGSVEKTLDVGTNLQTGEITIDLPYAKYLYYGKVMAGDPKADVKRSRLYERQKQACWTVLGQAAHTR